MTMSDEQYGHTIELKLTIRTPEGSPQEITYRQSFLTNQELLQEQASLTPKVIQVAIENGLQQTQGRGRNTV
jgi:hypothetical protein